MTDKKTDAQAIIDIAASASEPVELDPGKRYAVITPDHGVEIIERAPESALDAPRRTRGQVLVGDVASLKVLFDKYATGDSEVYADDVRHTFTAVLNASGGDAGHGFGDHRIALQLRKTPAWQAWAAIDGKWLDQATFADFVEERLIDIETPTAAEVMELAQSFEATTKADFKSGQLLDSGARTLKYEETVAARAGQTGELEIPREFILGLAPFEGGDAFRVKARFRYRLREGSLMLGVKLERPDDVLREAFAETVAKVAEATGHEVIVGTPAPALA